MLELAGRILSQPEGPPRLYRMAARMDAAGLFTGTDWEEPASLVPGLVANTLEQGAKTTVVLDAMSHLRLLAVANGDASHGGLGGAGAPFFDPGAGAQSEPDFCPAG